MATDRAYTVGINNTNGQSALALDELQLWLEWAGSRLLAMQIASPFPKEPTAAWPIFAQEANLAYGYTDERLRPPRPSAIEIGIMDDMLTLPSLASRAVERRVLQARLLITPVSHRRLYSWRRIAELLHTSPYTVTRMHLRALREIAPQVPEGKIYSFRAALTSYPL
jgi:hypothetical protein